MKKNNKFRNSGNSNAYSLNYKFDSISPAGKFSGTALDLIKKYNELAKEAHGSGDYIEMEVYRQYAEHYRKIVTEINERKNYKQEQQNNAENSPEKEDENKIPDTNTDSNLSEQNTVNENSANENNIVEPIVQTPMPIKKKTFKIVEIKSQETTDALNNNEEKNNEKPKRIVRRKKTEKLEDNKSSEAI